ncbi:MAG: ribosome small subunit-dependent GTPase A [bacterium]|nr:ribosome small subunit-dependent GTPase A [bacterium]
MSDLEGTVIRQHQRHYLVSTGSRVVDCAISSLLRKDLQYPEANAGSRRRRVENVRRIKVIDPVTVGDRVRFDDGEGGNGLIREILPRRNKISRRAAGGSKKEQILAANIDRVLPVFSANEPAPDWELLDRMLAIAEWQELPAVICFNKMDLADDEFRSQTAVYEHIGYRALYTSVVSDLGKEEFRELLKNHISLFMGSSGVGKTSLLNWLQPGLKLRTGEISQASGEGRHTTTHTELVELAEGGCVGDLPGVREFYLWDIEPDDIPSLFREFRPLLDQCRFRDCTHEREPGCAIKQAVEADEISSQRYESYLRLRQSP